MCCLCVPWGVADGRGHAAVHRQWERACGVRAGAVGRRCGDRPGEGGLCKRDGSALRGLFLLGSVGALSHASAACGVVALRVAESLGKRWSSPCSTWGARKHIDDRVRHTWDRCGAVRRDVLRVMADGRGHAAVQRQLERARGVRTGFVGRGRCDQPGDGGLCKLHGSALWGLFPRGSVEALLHACAAGGVLALHMVEGMRQEVVQPMFHLIGWGHLDNRVRHACD
jgi:hypothetical protein